MSTLQDNDQFLVERGTNSYQQSAIDLMSTIDDNDLMLVQRGADCFQVSCKDVKDQLGGAGGGAGASEVAFVIIGGGGPRQGGGTSSNGFSGGGAGGFLSSVPGELSGGATEPLPLLQVTAGSTYSITIGAAGSDTIFEEVGGVSYTALRGGIASGGGGSWQTGNHSGQPGTEGQGFAGGDGSPGAYAECQLAEYFCNTYCTAASYGGGGGAGSAANSKSGGDGIASFISGQLVYYSGGGNAIPFCTADPARAGIPGLGQENYGGGAGWDSEAKDGVVILRYPRAWVLENPGGGLVIDTQLSGLDFVSTITAGTGQIQFVTEPSLAVEFIIVAGGGAKWGPGLSGRGYGGGAAGGYISSVVGENSGGGDPAIDPINFELNTSYSITIGAAGSDTTFERDGEFNLTALRGNVGSGLGGGVGSESSPQNQPGNPGTPGQGFAGAAGSYASSACVKNDDRNVCNSTCVNSAYYGAGGGAGSVGVGRNGGDGVASGITGQLVYYAGGGNSVGYCNGPKGENGLGQENFGGGEGWDTEAKDGGIILRYPARYNLQNPGGGLTINTALSGSYSVSTISAGIGTIQFV